MHILSLWHCTGQYCSSMYACMYGLFAGMWCPLMSVITTLCCEYFSSSSVVSCAFSALCMYLKFGHHPHPLSYLCAKFCFFCGLRCWASPWRKIGTQSITHSPSLFVLYILRLIEFTIILPTTSNSSLTNTGTKCLSVHLWEIMSGQMPVRFVPVSLVLQHCPGVEASFSLSGDVTVSLAHWRFTCPSILASVSYHPVVFSWDHSLEVSDTLQWTWDSLPAASPVWHLPCVL